MIHISFDVWTAPYGTVALLGVIGHFMDNKGIANSVLIGLRRIEGCHSGENLAATIIPILEEFAIVENLDILLATMQQPTTLLFITFSSV